MLVNFGIVKYYLNWSPQSFDNDFKQINLIVKFFWNITFFVQFEISLLTLYTTMGQ